MHPMLYLAVQAARAAGHVIIRYMNRVDSLTISNKARNDFVSEVDQQAETEIIPIIRFWRKRVVYRKAMSISGL